MTQKQAPLQCEVEASDNEFTESDESSSECDTVYEGLGTGEGNEATERFHANMSTTFWILHNILTGSKLSLVAASGSACHCWSVGRSRRLCSIAFTQSSKISRIHAYLEVVPTDSVYSDFKTPAGSEIFLMDRGSHNGTVLVREGKEGTDTVNAGELCDTSQAGKTQHRVRFQCIPFRWYALQSGDVIRLADTVELQVVRSVKCSTANGLHKEPPKDTRDIFMCHSYDIFTDSPLAASTVHSTIVEHLSPIDGVQASKPLEVTSALSSQPGVLTLNSSLNKNSFLIGSTSHDEQSGVGGGLRRSLSRNLTPATAGMTLRRIASSNHTTHEATDPAIVTNEGRGGEVDSTSTLQRKRNLQRRTFEGEEFENDGEQTDAFCESLVETSAVMLKRGQKSSGYVSSMIYDTQEDEDMVDGTRNHESLVSLSAVPSNSLPAVFRTSNEKSSEILSSSNHSTQLHDTGSPARKKIVNFNLHHLQTSVASLASVRPSERYDPLKSVNATALMYSTDQTFSVSNRCWCISGFLLSAQKRSKIEAILHKAFGNIQDSDILVVDEPVKRTIKLLYALCSARKIVTKRWLDALLHARQVVPMDKYEVRGSEMETLHNFDVSTALTLAARHRANGTSIFCGKLFYVTRFVRPCEPGNDVRDLIRVAGGMVLKTIPAHQEFKQPPGRSANSKGRREESLVFAVITTPQEVSGKTYPKMFRSFREGAIPLVSTSYVYECVMHQKLLELDAFIIE